MFGNDCLDFDEDSMLDNILGNDVGGNFNILSDNVVIGNGSGFFGSIIVVGDEDDYDFVIVFVFDLVLVKMIVIFGFYIFGQIINFIISVSNQGNVLVMLI